MGGLCAVQLSAAVVSQSFTKVHREPLIKIPLLGGVYEPERSFTVYRGDGLQFN